VLEFDSVREKSLRKTVDESDVVFRRPRLGERSLRLSPGGDMKTLLAFIAIALTSGMLSASVHSATKPGYQSGTVVSVETHETPSNYAGSNPSDAPLQSEVYSYDIGIQLGCTVYRTRYDSAFDYLPAAFATDHPIEIKPGKHVLHVILPGDRDLRMGIDGRRAVKDTSCANNN
jgi:hypothetical protein